MDQKKVLATRERFGCVYECSCGTIHLAVGPVEIKFDRESLIETYEMMAEAVKALEPHPSESSVFGNLAIDTLRRHSN